MTEIDRTALSVRGISFAYGAKKALDEVAFSVEQGQCAMLLGPNGAGKSTLFSLITRLYDSHQGRILIGGYDVRERPREALARLGVVFQQSTLDLDLTVLQNLHYHAALYDALAGAVLLLALLRRPEFAAATLPWLLQMSTLDPVKRGAMQQRDLF